MKYTNIVFDIDGTLIDTEYAVLHSLQKTLEKVTGKTYEISNLKFSLGITGHAALSKLGIENIPVALELWTNYMTEFSGSVNVFSGLIPVLNSLISAGFKLGIVTSKTKKEYAAEFSKFGMDGLFETVVCADDTVEHKPLAAPLKKYMELSGTDYNQILYIGDSKYDMICAQNANVDFALAGWGADLNNEIASKYYLEKPEDLFKIIFPNRENYLMFRWLQRAMELQFLAQAGLTYSKDSFDIERFHRIREIAAEILCDYTDYGIDKVNEIFCNETGFQTPKLDTRAAIFDTDRILLVQELDGNWSLPGGWVDVDQSIFSNTVKEVKEETGLEVIPIKIIAIQDRNKHNIPIYAYGVCKVFVLCKNCGGNFQKNLETLDSQFFNINEIPTLALEKNSMEQIRMCFAANSSDIWETIFD